MAEEAGFSVKYVGEIERGEANTTFDAFERLAAAIDWNPLDAFKVEPITEGVRVLLLTEAEQMIERLGHTVKWLGALDAALDPAGRLRPALRVSNAVDIPFRKRPRASRGSRSGQ